MNKLKLRYIVFLLIFILLGIFVCQLGLYLDDASFAFPLIDQLYWQNSLNYIKNYSFFRFLSLAYYYPIYWLYFHLPEASHLIPLLFFIFFIWLIYKVARLQRFASNLSFYLSLLVLSLPFWVEAYSWFSSNTSLLVCILFFLQIYIIEKYNYSRKLMFSLVILQFMQTFLYETTIFMPLSLTLLLIKKQSKLSLSWRLLKKYLTTAFILFTPAVFYFFLRFVFPPIVETRIKLLTPIQMIRNWQILIRNFVYLFSQKEIKRFWLTESMVGFKHIFQHPVFSFIFITFALFFAFSFLYNYFPKKKTKPKTRLFFWLFSLILSLIPFSWQPGYLPFRTLILPFTLVIICLFFVFNHWCKYHWPVLFQFIIKGFFFSLFVFLLLVQTGMLYDYGRQSKADIRMAEEISRKTSLFGFDYLNKTNIYLKNFPDNILGEHAYGDFLFSIFHYYWSAKDFYAIQTKIWQDFAIESPNGLEVKAKVKKQDFLKLRPLVIFQYTNYKECQQGQCFKVKKVLK